MKYLLPLHEEFQKLQAQVGDEELVRLCLLEWRLEQKPTPNRKPNRLENCLRQLQGWKAELVKQVRQTVRWLLGNVGRASSLVETVNSWLRPFLWRRKGNGPVCLQHRQARHLQLVEIVLVTDLEGIPIGSFAGNGKGKRHCN